LFTALAAAVPRATQFCAYGKAAYGDAGRRAVYATIYLVILFEPPIFALSCVEAVRALAPSLSRLTAGAIVSALILPLAQLQHLEDVAATAWVGVAGMALAAAASVGGLLTAPRAALPRHRRPTALVARGVRPAAVGAALMDVVFAYGGQVNWVRYIKGMRDPSRFGACAAVAVAGMMVAYAGVGAVGYAVLGSRFDFTAPLTSILPPSPALVAANVGLLAHALLAYQINVNVWSHVALHVFGGEGAGADEEEEEGGGGGGGGDPPPHASTPKPDWFGVTALCIAFSAAVAHAVPAFSSLMAVIASLGDLAGAYALPAACVLALAPAALAWPGERAACRALVPVALAASVVGMGLSVKALVDDVAH
jgi:vesicular inhibitory amino acid transporter